MEKKKKLLVFHPIIAPYRIDLFNKLHKEFEAEICLFWHNLKDQKFNYDTITSKLTFTPQYIQKKDVINRLIQFNPDIALVGECGLIPMLVVLYKKLFRKRFKIVSIIDDSYAQVNGEHFTRKHELGEKVLIPYFDHVINVEPRVADYFSSNYGKGKGCYFPIIADENRVRSYYRKALPISEEYIKKYHLRGKKILLFVGRIVELKNLERAIEAFIRSALKDVLFVIVGSGEQENFLKKKYEEYKDVVFVGREEDLTLYAWYNIAEAFILPSTQEPFGAVTNEALMGGCFSLISHKAGSSCLIKEEINGRIIDPYDIDRMAKVIGETMKSLPERAYPLQLRPNLMQCTFDDSIRAVIDVLYN